MSRTTIDLDDEQLAAAARELDTSATARAGNPEVGARARAVQAALATRSQHQGVGVVDLLTAAVAEHHRATVLHYDSDFDQVAAVTGQHTRWVVPRGSIA